jgi:hypothetical protein
MLLFLSKSRRLFLNIYSRHGDTMGIPWGYHGDTMGIPHIFRILKDAEMVVKLERLELNSHDLRPLSIKMMLTDFLHFY